MAGPGLQHGRVQTTLLISKILNSHAGVSPFTLAIDSMAQSAKTLLQQQMRRASESETEVIFISFETLRKPSSCKHFLRAHETSFEEISKTASKLTQTESTRFLLVIDSLHPLISHSSGSITNTLFSLLSPNTTLFAVLHGDQPISRPLTMTYSPSPLTVLRYIATTVLTLCSLPHMISEQQARLRSVGVRPSGLHDVEEGILQSLGSNNRSFVVDMEYRRKSGRSVRALFTLQSSPSTRTEQTKLSHGGGNMVLLDEHPEMQAILVGRGLREPPLEGIKIDTATFNLELSDKQKKDREGIVLPYFDAQSKDDGIGAGGRILYDMGEEDDFDDEEDEI